MVSLPYKMRISYRDEKERALKAVEILKELRIRIRICSLTASNPFEFVCCRKALLNVPMQGLILYLFCLTDIKRLRIMQVQMLKILKIHTFLRLYKKQRQNQSSEWRKGFYPILTCKVLIRLKN